jgi:hypothetical protein
MRSQMDPAGGWASSARGSDAFPSPWLDMASLSMPEDIRSVLKMAEYVFEAQSTYKMAMQRIVAYFLTDVDFGATDSRDTLGDDEKEKWQNLFTNIGVMPFLFERGMDRMCFHGDVKAVTRNGVFKLRDLEGQTVDVLSEGGVYRPATFKAFGRQPLWEVEFSDGRTVLATPEHEWIVKNSTNKLVRIPTTKLIDGHRIERTVAPRPEQNEEFREGVRHGFVFGDGTRYNEGCQSAACFFGDKIEVLPYFDGYGSEVTRPPSREEMAVKNGLPARYKDLPENDKSASYWYGFVCGFLAADGSVDTYGCALLTQSARITLERIVEQLPRIGMCTGPVREHTRTSSFVRSDGSVESYTGPMYYVTLLKRFMLPQDFLLEKHREKFERNFEPTSYGQFIRVKGARPTGITDDVFCCVEMETHSFVVEQAVITGNCYGNAFTSLQVPFRRFMCCPKCGLQVVLKNVYENPDFKFKFSNDFSFTATCPKCKTGSGYRGPWKLKDEPDNRPDALKLKYWSPHDIEILHDQFTDDVAYLWKIPEDYKRQVREGTLFHLERCPQQVMEAIKKNQLFRFHPGVIHHMKEATLGGRQNRGWGITRLLTNFRQAWYVQVLHRYNEAIALDYVIPFRLITPAVKGGSGGMASDPLLSMNGGDFMGQVRSMIRKRRRDPASWSTLPFPVQYQALGGDAAALAPRELLDQGLETLLNGAGTPVELYKGTLQLQTAPVSLRLFEATWHHLVHDNNRFLNWLVERISRVLSWESIKAVHKRVTHADDLQRHMALLELMTTGLVSRTTGLRSLGLEYRDELKAQSEEAMAEQTAQQEMQEQMDQSAMGAQVAQGMPAQPGMPAGQPADPAAAGGQGQVDPATGMPMTPPPVTGLMASGNMPQTPEQMLQTAESLAQELLGLPEPVKDSELRALAKKNEVLHSLVKAKMNQIRNQAKMQGGAMLMQQQFGGPTNASSPATAAA